MTQTRSSENRWRGRLIRYAPLILWTLVVLGLSSAQASMQQTSLIIRPILKFLFPSSPEATIDLIHAYIRKSAHFTEYAILAFFAFRAAAGSSINLLRRFRMLAPVVFVALIAATDEYHQSFVPSRTSSGWDVLLDISGSVFVVIISWLKGLKAVDES
jgi:VanZ family protein